MAKARIHVNQAVIRKNNRDKKQDPVITVKTYKSNTYTNDVTILCPCCEAETAKVVYSPDKPLSCGAKVWIEVIDCDKLVLKDISK